MKQVRTFKYSEFVAEYKGDFQLTWLAPLTLRLVDNTKMMTRLPKLTFKIQLHIAQLYGAKQAYGYTKMFLAQALSGTILCIALFVVIGLALGGDTAMIIWGVIIGLMLPFVLIKDLDRKIKARHRAIVLELPLFLNKVILLIGAGENIQKAIIKIVSQKGKSEAHPLYKEFNVLIQQLNNNYSFPQAMEDLSQRCGVQEVSIFTNTIILNYRRGGTELVTALRALSHQLWTARKTMAIILGEEASAKLVFPLIIIFIIVMVIVGAPAAFMMQF